MRSSPQGPKHASSREDGAMIIMVAVLLFLFVSLALLIVDTSSLISTKRQLQNAADAASLAAVGQLTVPMTTTAWTNAKKAVLLAVLQSRPRSLRGDTSSFTNKTLRYTEGTATLNDTPGYEFNTATVGNLTMRARRGVSCLNAGGVRTWFSLEESGAYCYANSVEVQLTLANLPVFFGRLVGHSGSETLIAPSTARLTLKGECSDNNCDDLGTYDAIAGFVPKVLCTP
jgi:uncharacterized membrane protein